MLQKHWPPRRLSISTPWGTLWRWTPETTLKTEMVAEVEYRYRIPTILPSVEYVRRGLPLKPTSSTGCSMALTMRPVRISQLTTQNGSRESPVQEHVNMRLSGEKMSARELEGASRSNSRFWTRRRVVESSMATVTDSDGLIARYLLHGDHTISLTSKGDPVAKVAEPNGTGIPHTTLVRGRACAS